MTIPNGDTAVIRNSKVAWAADEEALWRNVLMEQSKDGVLILDLMGNVLEANTSGSQMLGYTPEEMLRLHWWDWDTCWTPDEALEKLREFGAGSQTFETRHRRKDGSFCEVEVSVVSATCKGRTLLHCVHRDISRRWRTEHEIQRLQKELQLASREAGMVEVASSVLHNVGNVLNSVNISASLLAERIKKSKTSKVAQLAALLESHASDLPGYFATAPTARQVPSYVRHLADLLSKDQAELVTEIDLICRHIEHIKEIVAIQQSYSTVFGLTQRVNVVDLIEDAISMNAGALARHDVEIVRHYDPQIPEITVERHKVLQILVNLIRNAKYACDDSGRMDKRLTLTLTAGSNAVRIVVADNGVGILPENLDRIFNHGFTTRKDGHGIGLHSTARAAKEMGGSISVHSDGHLQGASFTLELPLQPPK